MKITQKRGMVTSLLTFLFIVISITGIMMFFNMQKHYIVDMHEILGLTFVLFALFHIFYNWKSMKSYFKKRIFIFSGVIILLISTGFIIDASNTPRKGESGKLIVRAVLKASLNKVVPIWGVNIQFANKKLKEAGLIVRDLNSIIDIAKRNNISPSRVIKIILRN